MDSIPENLEALLRSLADDALKEDEKSKRVTHSSGQVMRLWLDAKRTEQGYRGAEVLVGPSRTEEAYVAALLALYGEAMEREADKTNQQSGKMARASNAILFSELMQLRRTGKARRKRDAEVEEMRERDAVVQAMKDLRLAEKNPLEEAHNPDFFDGYRLIPVYRLLRHFRPDFDRASARDRIALVERTIGYVNDYLKALQRLTAFLQYGEAGAYEGLATKRVTKAEKQVRAAELREVVTERGAPLPYRKIGQLLGEKPTPTQSDRSYNRRIQKKVDDGKDILKQALGEQGYQDYMEEKRAEWEHWQTLSEEEQSQIHMEETFGITSGDAYEVLDGRQLLDARENQDTEA
jgi:hypothetical protein